MKAKYWGILLLLGVLLSACIPVQAPANNAASATPSLVPASTVVVLAQNTVGPLPSAIPPGTPVVIAPTLESTVEGYNYVGLPECNNPDESKPINGEDGGATLNADGLWEIDIHKNGCNLIFEGLLIKGERIHHVVILRSSEGENTALVNDGKFTYSEGSIWQKERDKNMQDITNMEDPPESMKLVNDHRANMQANNYDWPIDVGSIDGSTQTFAPGETWEGMPDVNHCGFTEPTKIPVHGEKISGKNQFSAAIGAEDCTTIAWIDGSPTPEQWVGARDAANKVVYATIEAWLMPSLWGQTEIDAWVAQQ